MKKKRIVLLTLLTIALGSGGFLFYDWYIKTNAQKAEPSVTQYSWKDAQGIRHFTDREPPVGASDIRIVKGHKYIAPPLVYAIKKKGVETYKKIKKKLLDLKKKKKKKKKGK